MIKFMIEVMIARPDRVGLGQSCLPKRKAYALELIN